MESKLIKLLKMAIVITNLIIVRKSQPIYFFLILEYYSSKQSSHVIANEDANSAAIEIIPNLKNWLVYEACPYCQQIDNYTLAGAQLLQCGQVCGWL
jgi:ABC-type microcin C transport system permease subunit YejE